MRRNNEGYVRWLMESHPNEMPSEWLAKTSITSKSNATQKPTETSTNSNTEVLLNYDNVYGALNRIRKRSTSCAFSTKKENYISEYLYQTVPMPKLKKKQIRISGTRVLTKNECMRHLIKRKGSRETDKRMKTQRKKDAKKDTESDKSVGAASLGE